MMKVTPNQLLDAATQWEVSHLGYHCTGQANWFAWQEYMLTLHQVG